MKKPITYTLELATEYQSLWDKCIIRGSHEKRLARQVLEIASHEDRYHAAGDPFGIPWVFIGCVHMLEGSANFRTHLHNGDPLTARTVNVPEGRPVNGDPPFTWEASARDALVLKRLDQWGKWDPLESTCRHASLSIL